jgi:hypothetical protein
MVDFKSELLFLCQICSIWPFVNCIIFFCNVPWVYHCAGWLVFGHCHNEELKSSCHHTPCKFPHNVVCWVVKSGCKFDWSQQNQHLWGVICCGVRYDVLRILQLLAEWGNMLFCPGDDKAQLSYFMHVKWVLSRGWNMRSQDIDWPGRRIDLCRRGYVGAVRLMALPNSRCLNYCGRPTLGGLFSWRHRVKCLHLLCWYVYRESARPVKISLVCAGINRK